MNMKSRIQSIMLACVALASAFFVSCSDDALVEEASRNYGDQPFELKVTQSGPNSRLELGQDGLTTQWEPGDKLVLIDKTRKLAPIFLNCTLEEKASTATFMSESGVPAGDYWVIYNYNENLAYGHKGFQSVDDINSHDDLVLWADLNIAEGSSSASVELKHLYAKVRVVLENADNLYTSVQIGMYSSKQGFPVFKQFTSNGLVDAEYGINPNSMYYTGNYTYFPSKRKFHNIRFGYYGGEWSGDAENMIYDFTKSEGLSALVLPADLSNEDMFFYVIVGGESSETCYEIKKEGVEIKAGTSYKVVLDLNEATVSTLSSTYDNNQYVYELSSAAEWRHAAYRNSTGYYKLTQDIDFSDDVFFPISAGGLIGVNNTLSNISLDWSNEDNVGLIRHEWYYNENNSMMNTQFFDNATRVSDLTLENVMFKGNNYVGALGGSNVSVNNCDVVGTSVIEGKGNYVGGLVGANDFDSYFSGESPRLIFTDAHIGQSCTVKGNNYVGGIVGGCVGVEYWTSNLTLGSSLILMESCKSQATVTATEDYVGGIFGKLGGSYYGNSASISIEFSMEDFTFSLVKCVNEGSVTGRHYVGGIGGDFAIMSNNYSPSLDRVVLSQSYSDGDVTGETKVGGILGTSQAAVNTCYSIGEVSASTSTVGGIVGDFSNGWQARIANCYSLAEISGTEKAGGIVGLAGGGMMGVTIQNCYYAADPETVTIGGIVGYSSGSSNVINCLTTLNSLGTNLRLPLQYGVDVNNDGITDYDWDNDGDIDDNDLWIFPDNLTGSVAAVTSILENIAVINGDNAYSTNYWPLEDYPWYCVKFASFQTDTDAPGFDNETVN